MLIVGSAGGETTGGFSYAQNVQTLLVTYTTSYYNYNANLHRALGEGDSGPERLTGPTADSARKWHGEPEPRIFN